MDRREVAKIVKGIALDNWDIAVISKAVVFDKQDSPRHDVYEYPNILKMYVKTVALDYKMLVIEFVEDGKRWERSHIMKRVPKES